jgi:hypothetical protein
VFLTSQFDSYAPLIERLTKEGKPMLLLPELQEVNDLPCDTGSVSPHTPPFGVAPTIEFD